MHPNAHLISSLLSSLDRHDLQGVSACYHEAATFHDIAFHIQSRANIRSMWRMVTSGDLRVTCQDVWADENDGRAKSVDDYTFRETSRKVSNPITSHFRFRGGKIIEHRDECDARLWAAMAIGGIPGLLAGRLRFLRSWKAEAMLRGFLRDHPESEVAAGAATQ